MATLDTLKLADVRAGLGHAELAEAHDFVNRVDRAVRSGDTLQAQVIDDRAYEVELRLAPDGVDSRCTCRWGGGCKHVAALLLKWVLHRETFVDRTASRPAAPDLAVEPVQPPPTYRPNDLPPWLAASFEERQRAVVAQLAAMLHEVRQQDLRAIARRRGRKLKGNEKDAVAMQLADILVEPGVALQAAGGLDDEHRRMLAALVLMGEGAQFAEAERVAAVLGGLGQYKQALTYTRHLCLEGLALPGAALGRYSSVGDFTPLAVAREVLPLVQRTILEGLRSRSPELEEGPARKGVLRLADPFPFVRAVSQVALLLERAPVALRPPMARPRSESRYQGLQGWDYDPVEVAEAERSGSLQPYADPVLTVPPPQPSLPDEAIQSLAPVAGGEERLEFIYSLLVATGFFQPGSPVTVWPQVRKAFLCLDELAQRAVLARTYFMMGNWSEVWGALRTAPGLAIRRHVRYAYRARRTVPVDLGYARLAMVRALACLPDGEWLPLGALFRLLRAIWPQFEDTPQHDQDYYGGPRSAWFLTTRGGQAPLPTRSDEEWAQAQGRFVRYMLAGPLHWLGLADLQFEGEELVAVRLHGVADLYWGLREVPPAPPGAARAAPVEGEAATAEGEEIAVRPSAVSAEAHGLLERIARLDEAGAGRFVYRLDPRAAFQSFEAGVALPEVLASWQRLLPIPMPETVRTRLEEWWRAYGRVRIYRDVAVIELADDFALAEMKAVTSLEEHIVAEVSPRLVIVDPDAVAELAAELEKAGFTPRLTEEV